MAQGRATVERDASGGSGSEASAGAPGTPPGGLADAARAAPVTAWHGRARMLLRSWARRAITHETGRWILLAGSVGVICGVCGFVLQSGTDVLACCCCSTSVASPR